MLGGHINKKMMFHLDYMRSSTVVKLCIWVVFSFQLMACNDIQPDEDEVHQSSDTREIKICHANGDGSFGQQELKQQDLPTHLIHGDGIPGGPVPGTKDSVFSEACTVIKDTNEGPCLGGMAHIEDFCIDRWEGSLKNHAPFEAPEAAGIAQTVYGAIPQGYISGEMAAAACEAAGKRLCTSPEWLRACQGPDSMIFPYGNTHIGSACNEGRELHPVIELFGEATDWSSGQMNDSRINQLPNTLDRTAYNPVCMSAEGVYDLHGNLHEWVADSEGTFRGGFYVDAEINGTGCLYRTTAHGRTYHDYSTGFRCCADAQ